MRKTLRASNDNGLDWGQYGEDGTIWVDFEVILIRPNIRPDRPTKVWLRLQDVAGQTKLVGNDNRTKAIIHYAEELYGKAANR